MSGRKPILVVNLNNGYPSSEIERSETVNYLNGKLSEYNVIICFSDRIERKVCEVDFIGMETTTEQEYERVEKLLKDKIIK